LWEYRLLLLGSGIVWYASGITCASANVVDFDVYIGCKAIMLVVATGGNSKYTHRLLVDVRGLGVVGRWESEWVGAQVKEPVEALVGSVWGQYVNVSAGFYDGTVTR
jgi:hypothetical protein